ncbi:MAG: M1 family aminopeptidase, partial [Desulfuromonadales bacterium]|nr:M1 family aminopeptidase [Desulfuromonadales bacterium]
MEQKLRLKLDPEAHLLEVSALLSAGTETTLPQSYRLAAHAEIDGVWADGAVAAYAFADGVLRLKQAPAATLKLRYVARFDDAPPQQIVGIEDPSYGVSATIMPQGSYLSAGAEWHPRAQGLNSLFQVQIVGPPGMAGVTSGRLLEHVDGEAETVTRWQTQLPQAALALAAGPFQIEQQELDGIQLLTFLRSENAALANGYLQSTKEYLQLYQELFGPYPYGKFAVVENFYPTGYGLPGWTLLGSRVIRLPFIRTTSLPHEIAHAWWGNAIEVDYGAGNWGEGLATYVADYLLKERADVSEALEYRRKLLRDYAALVAPGDDFPLVDFRSRASRSEQAVGYGKAAFVFHMLRQLIGDEAFWAGLKQAATQGKGKTYRWDDLQRHFQSVTEVELTDFFAQWLQRSGAPRLSLSDVTALETEAGWQVSGTLRQEQKGKAYGL